MRLEIEKRQQQLSQSSSSSLASTVSLPQQWLQQQQQHSKWQSSVGSNSMSSGIGSLPYLDPTRDARSRLEGASGSGVSSSCAPGSSSMDVTGMPAPYAKPGRQISLYMQESSPDFSATCTMFGAPLEGAFPPCHSYSSAPSGPPSGNPMEAYSLKFGGSGLVGASFPYSSLPLSHTLGQAGGPLGCLTYPQNSFPVSGLTDSSIFSYHDQSI